MAMGNSGARADREMQALMRKVRKLAARQRGTPQEQQDREDLEAAPGKRRFVDVSGEHDVRVEDATADEIFREMKRRDF